MDLKEIFGEELSTKLTTSTDETVKQVIVKLNEKKLILDDGKLVPQYRIKELSDQITEKDRLIKKNEDDLKALKLEAENIPTLKSKITEMQTSNKAAKDEFDANQIKTKKDFAIKEYLMNAKVGEADARDLLILKFDPTKIELDEAGKVKGKYAEDTLQSLMTNPAFKPMFGMVVMQGQEHQGGDNPNPTLGTLEAKLVAAQKAGKMAEVVAIRKLIFEEQQKT
jgi:uncharacterized coiled-coil protein SlyX